MEWITDPNAWIALATLTALEIVLGIDNIVFISIVSGKLPKEEQPRARIIGLALAMIMRIGLLFSLSWLLSLTQPIFTILEQAISGRDLILVIGGLFLIGKSTFEIHEKLEGEQGHSDTKVRATLMSVLIQIALLDIVFSLDSVITAIGMADELVIMVLAVVIAVGFMMIFATPISDFVDQRPTLKMLALSFLVLIGVMLVAEGFDQHISKGYIYFAMAFSLLVEALNLRIRGRSKQPVELRTPYTGDLKDQAIKG